MSKTIAALKKILITGATGYIGSNIVRRLIKDNWDVHVIVRPESRLSQIQNILGRVKLHSHDGSSEGLVKIVKDAKPEIVFHLASLFLAQHETKDVTPLIKDNVLFGAQLLEAMTVNGVYRLVNTGTSWQHFENKEYNPVCLYAATKQAFESILVFYTETTPLKAITLKLYDTYGPDDPRQKLFTLLRKVAREQQQFAMSAGEQLIDLVYIDDVVNAFMVAANLLINGKVQKQENYAVSSGKPIKLKDLVAIYSKVIGKQLPINWGARPYRPREVMIPWNKGKPLPGWKPKTNIREGIMRMEHIYE